MTTPTEAIHSALTSFAGLRSLIANIIVADTATNVTQTALTDLSLNFIDEGVVIGDLLYITGESTVRTITNVTNNIIFYTDVGLPSSSFYTIIRGDHRVYALLMPQDITYPAVTISKVSQLRETTMSDSGGDGVENQRCSIDIFDSTLSSCEAVAEQVRLALIAYESANFKAVQVFNLDLYEDDTKLYHVVVDYSVWYRH